MLDRIFEVVDSTPTYWYQGNCADSGKLLQLPRTQGVEQIARSLMMELAQDDRFAREGKMYGILLVETNQGEIYSLKAFSGLLNGEAVVAGWVPPIPGRDRVAIQEAATLRELAIIKQELIDLDRTSERAEYRSIAAAFRGRIEQLSIEHRQRKAVRQQQRELYQSTLSNSELTAALNELVAQSCQDGRERDRLKKERHAILQPLQAIIDQADDRIRILKQQRKIISHQLQEQMHQAYRLMNFLGTSSSLRALIPAGIPTGTGDCCAPKLLHYAASQGLRPIALAEFWWGDGSEGVREWGSGGVGGNKQKVQGEFYGACLERCQPLMGFMLAGLSSPNSNGLKCSPQSGLLLKRSFDNFSTTHLANAVLKRCSTWGNPKTALFAVNCQLSTVNCLKIIYEDEYLIAIDKPSGLLSVPGRSFDLQDSVLTRLRQLYPEIYPVHRLDRDTSGILLLARDKQSYRHLSQQFEQRQIHKVYTAILGGIVTVEQGSNAQAHPLRVVDLPLWGDPLDRPRQQVNFNLGKPSLTKFQVISQIDGYTRIEFIPVTGRTHQLRVHAADARGLGTTILGDRLYGCQANAQRLHLHARELTFTHPQRLERIALQIKCPF